MKRRPLLLDPFCGAGGAAMGYHRAGFDVVGVDNRRGLSYPFPYICTDAMTFPLDGFDAIHASPPCQDHSPLRATGGLHHTGWMLDATLERLRAQSAPWVVENVEGSPLPIQQTLDGRYGILLCGSAFGLRVAGMDMPRHRRFECSFPVWAHACSHEVGNTMGVYGNGTNTWHREQIGRNLRVAECREAMGIDWMVREELNQAIPPVYSEFIGAQLLDHIRATSSARR